MVIMDATIVNVALPSMKVALGTSLSWLQWVVVGYTLTFACFLLSAGHLGDQYGEKKLFQIGLMGFVVTSLGCGFSTTALALTGFRLLQGICASFMVPTSLALINAMFTDKKARARAMGFWAAAGGIAGATGPIAGACLTAFFSWRAVFFVNLPIGLICFLLTAKSVRATTKEHVANFDIAGQVFGVMSIAALSFSLVEVGRFGWHSPLILTVSIIFLISIMAFLYIEKNCSEPMFPLYFFKSKQFSSAIIVGLLMNLGFYGVLFLLPFYFQHIRGYTVLMTGFALLPLMTTISISSYLSGRVVSHVEPKYPMLIGLILAAIGFWCMLIVGSGSPPYWEFILPFAIIGFGVAFTMPAATIAIIRSVPTKRAGTASGAFNTSRQIGSLLGVAIFGSIVAASKGFITGMQVSLYIAIGAFFFSCLAVSFMG